jgi:hypothetical protein
MDPNGIEEQNPQYQYFLKERGNIHKDIKDFLAMTLKFCNFIPKTFNELGRKKLHSLIESLCLIHALYGYPNSDKIGKSQFNSNY